MLPLLNVSSKVDSSNSSNVVADLVGPALSSVLVYQSTNWSLVMIDITPCTYTTAKTTLNPNIFTRFVSPKGEAVFTNEYRGVGFAASYNVLNPLLTNESQLYARLTIGDSRRGSDVDLVDYNYHYNQETLVNGNLSIRPDPVARKYASAYVTPN